MQVDEFPSCCSAVLISSFYDYGRENTLSPKQQIINKLKEYFKYYFEGEGSDYPKTFFATTNSNEQGKWETALKELGFKPRKFASRHAKTAHDKYLNFWSLYTIPKDLKPWIKEQIKLMKERETNDNW